MSNENDNPDADYRRSADVVFRQLREQADFARKLHAEYGKWLITTLYLVHAGAIAGLLFKGAEARPAYLAAVWWFVAGLVLALSAGFWAWVILSALAEARTRMADHRMLRSKQHWPTEVPLKSIITGALWAAIGFGVASLLCIPIGAAAVWCLWR